MVDRAERVGVEIGVLRRKPKIGQEAHRCCCGLGDLVLLVEELLYFVGTGAADEEGVFGAEFRCDDGVECGGDGDDGDGDDEDGNSC